MERIICLAVGYVFGLFQTGYLVGKMHHIDIRQKGSGNSGTTNALRVMGWKAGACTFIGDVLKCILAVVLMRYVYRDSGIAPLLGMYAGLGATLGHNFPFYMKFKGGKGIAVMAGLIASTSVWMIPIPLVSFLVAVMFTRYVSLGSLLASSTFFLEIVMFGKLGGFDMAFPYRMEVYVIAFVLMALAWIRHKENIVRLLHGTENKFGTKKN